MDYNHLFTKESSKTLNKTNLVYIGIFGLFNLYNVEIDFDKQVNIFIGENGLGKTTILNCIYYLLEGKFSKLGSIEFSEIKIQFKNDTKKYTITSADVNDYNRKNMSRSLSYKRYDEMDMYIADIIENIAPDGEFNEIYDDHEIAGHKLDELYDDLSSINPTYISDLENLFSCSSYKGCFKTLKEFLSRIKEYFVKWRYAYSSGAMNFNLNTMSDVINFLNDYSKEKYRRIADVIANNVAPVVDNQTMSIFNLDDIKNQ